MYSTSCCVYRVEAGRHPGSWRPGQGLVVRGSGHLLAGHEALFAPDSAVEHLAEGFCGVPDIDEAGVERREAKTHDSRFAVVADDALVDQRLDDRVAFRVLEAHMAAPTGMFQR